MAVTPEAYAAGPGAVSVGGDVHAPITTNVYGGDGPVFTVETPPPELPHEPADLAALREQPSKLLNARRRVIPFSGRTRELADLNAWRQNGPRLAAQLIYAAGGEGKTRLAARAAEHAAAAGWAVGWARHRTDTPGGGAPLTEDGHRPLLIVVDYAERWPMSHLQSLLARYSGHTGPLRVLLLARSLSWWSVADTICERLGIITGVPVPLEPLAGTDAERRELFEAACRRFAEIYGLPASTEFAVPGGPADRAYGSVLTVHMAALAVVDAEARDRRPPLGARDLSRYLLNRECHYWSVLHGEHRSATAARAAFIASITGAVPRPAGAALLARSGLPEAAGTSAQQILDAHARCYPPATAGTVLEPLYPDRLAEDFIGLTLRTDQPDSLADTWCGSALAGVFAREDGQVPGHAGRGLIFLAAAAATWPHVGAALRTLLHADPSLAVDAGGPALLAITPYADAAIAAAISRHVTERSIDLHPAAALLSCGILQVSLLLNSRRTA
ncbi:P-loop NTPase [Actinoplanes auranticolor]|uniref:Novel STAND NTPase 5 domain-containing protein n=1 Tax=Actinoplanes auranticolor TaxID=47988 RepID=A0A919S7X2_9ACTN|nr:hypothetical protein [Actinoplanes auranticolor]GIM67132.1 hypothetical protein Aau02nite_26030 [Actinoplanes auranticolor]